MGKILPLKELKDCLELHPHQSLYSIKLLTKRFFEVVFLEEEGTTRVGVMVVVEWEGLSMNFFKWHTLTSGRLKESCTIHGLFGKGAISKLKFSFL